MRNPFIKNQEGYSDPTAYKGTKNVIAEEEATEKELSSLIKTLKYIIGLSGFELLGRIELRHKKSGRVFK